MTGVLSVGRHPFFFNTFRTFVAVSFWPFCIRYFRIWFMATDPVSFAILHRWIAWGSLPSLRSFSTCWSTVNEFSNWLKRFKPRKETTTMRSLSILGILPSSTLFKFEKYSSRYGVRRYCISCLCWPVSALRLRSLASATARWRRDDGSISFLVTRRSNRDLSLSDFCSTWFSLMDSVATLA